jgi:hemolysin III
MEKRAAELIPGASIPIQRRFPIRELSAGQTTSFSARTGRVSTISVVQNGETPEEILANCITHGLGVGLAIIGSAWLIMVGSRAPTLVRLSCTIYAITLVLVYLCSTLYHALCRTRLRHIFLVLDHVAIYLLIAGTYTPFALVSLGGRPGWMLFTAAWAFAAVGIMMKSIAMEHFTNGRLALASVALYLFQGWLVLFVLPPLARALGWHGLAWLGAGGAAYTLGIVFFAFDRVRYFHAAWHIFVLAGSVAHFFAVTLYVLPARF